MLGPNSGMLHSLSQLVLLIRPQFPHLVSNGGDLSDPSSFQLRLPTTWKDVHLSVRAQLCCIVSILACQL